MKKFTYTNLKTGRVIFETVEPNYASRDTVDAKVKTNTGHDPRLEPHIIECQIRVISPREAEQLLNKKQDTRKNQRNVRRYKREV